MKRNRGLTLIETAVAIALLAIIVVSILSAFSATTIAANRHAGLAALDRLTRSEAELIKSKLYVANATNGSYGILSATGYTFSYQVSYYDPTTNTFATTNPDNGLQEIVLTVSGPNAISEQLDILKVQP